MKKAIVCSIILSITLGIIITLFTGLFTWPGVVGATWWGYPFFWMSKAVVGPGYIAPLIIWWNNLIFDSIFWSIVVFLILLVFYKKKLFNRLK